jgi:hypothetical protein
MREKRNTRRVAQVNDPRQFTFDDLTRYPRVTSDKTAANPWHLMQLDHSAKSYPECAILYYDCCYALDS